VTHRIGTDVEVRAEVEDEGPGGERGQPQEEKRDRGLWEECRRA
jgi:hypothetical protein